VQSQQQGPEAAAAAFGVGVADDHEFLALLALELDPVRAAAATVRAVDAFADQPFELQTAGAVEQGFDRLVKVGRKLEYVRLIVPKQLAQGVAAALQRYLTQVPTTKKRQVEQVIGNAFVMLGIEGVLQGLEVCCAIFVNHHHFAVEPGRTDTQRAQGSDLPGHFAAPVVAIAGEQADIFAVDAGHDAVAVEL